MISTYAELKQAIQNWCKRSDVLSVLDDFIDLTESDIAQRLHIRDMEFKSTYSTSTSTRFLALPSNYLQFRQLKITETNCPDLILEYEPPLNLNVSLSAGKPLRFTITNQIEFDRISDAVYTAELQYFASVTPLSDAAPTNAILTRFPMIYLYGCLFHYGNWAQNDEFVQKYSVLSSAAIDAANHIDRRGRYGPTPAIRTFGGFP